MLIRLQKIIFAQRRSSAARIVFLAAAMISCVLCALQLMQVSVYGFTVVNGVVTARSGFVRKEPSTSSSCVFCVTNGDIVTITGAEKLPNGEKWYKIQMGDQGGFIRSDLVLKPKTKKDETQAQPSQNADPAVQTAGNPQLPAVTTEQVLQKAVTGVVNGYGVIMREKETTASNKLMSLNKGSTVVVTGSVASADGYIWYAVKAAKDGVPYSGFIRSDLLIVNSDVPVTANPAAVPTALPTTLPATLPTTLPATLSTTLPATLPATVPVTGGTGVTGAGAASTAGTAAVQIGSVKGMGVNVRKKPVDGKVVAKVSTGQQVTVTKWKQADDGYIWYKISFVYEKMPNKGFIRSDFVEGVVFN